jgi:deoxyribodipyrimidine photolyase-related protein
MAHYENLRLILGDQLHAGHSWFNCVEPDTLYVIAELKQETDYVRHHVQKVCGFFAAMEHFARQLTAAGHQVLHLTLDETSHWANLDAMLSELVQRHQINRFEYQQPDEYRLSLQLEKLRLPRGIVPRVWDTEHFLLPHGELCHYFKAGQHVRMETFYRRMRRRFNILMDGDEPLGQRWNFDTENRQRLREEDIEVIPRPLLFSNDVSAILDRLQKHGIKTLGTPAEQLPWPVSREQSLQLLAHFVQTCLPDFGRFQDAMTGKGEHRWSLYHSRLSFALNCKLLTPEEVLNAAISRYRQHPAEVELAQVEGFVRQILGWREYVRGVYWANMPDYAESNELDAGRTLPDFFWTGETRMRCLREAIGQSLEHAYAHHIQRLMVTGNFCLLTGIDPAQVDQWYLGIYMDALQWVELPNTRGMSQFADGGLIATKPYAASGNYVSKMSDYCKDCYYNVRERTGARSCPLNSLYWHFMSRHRNRLERNPRIGMNYRNWDKMTAGARSALLDRAEGILADLESL